MKRIGLACLLLAVLLVFTLPIAAQEALPLTQTYHSIFSPVTFHFPAGWTVQEGANGGHVGFFATLSNQVSTDLDLETSPLRPDEVRLWITWGDTANFLDTPRPYPDADLLELDTCAAFTSPSCAPSMLFVDGYPGLYWGNSTYLSLDIQHRFGVVWFFNLHTAAKNIEKWQPTLFAIATDVLKNAPKLDGESKVEVTQTYSSDDGSLSFQYPVGWMTKTIADSRVSFGNVPEDTDWDKLQPGQIAGEIRWNQNFQAVCVDFGFCSWVGIVTATPDTLLDDIASFFHTVPNSTWYRMRFGNNDALLIFSPNSPAACIIKTGDTFVVLFFASAHDYFELYDEPVFLAIANSIQYTN